MLLRTLKALLFITAALYGLTAVADSWKHESEHEYYQQDDSSQGQDQERDRHHHKRRYREHEERHDQAKRGDDDRVEYDDRHGPPPWAPAYGDRRGQRDDRRGNDDNGYEREGEARQFTTVTERIGISSGRCNSQAVGTIVGGILGGVIGRNVTQAGDKSVGTAAGILIGSIVGNQIGRNMDEADASCTNEVLERAADGQTVRWKNPDSGYRYSITPYKTYRRSDGIYCRDYMAVVRGSASHKYREVACRTDTGIWKRR